MKHKDLAGYSGEYRIYEDGRIWSYKTKRFLKKQLDKDGYYRYTVCRGGKVKNMTLHRWLYLSFVGDIPKDNQINHKDGVKTNNNLNNLEVCTPKENTLHAWGTGLARRRVGSTMHSSKLTENDIPKIFELSKQGYTNKHIAELFCVDASNISKILHKNTWLHV